MQFFEGAAFELSMFKLADLCATHYDNKKDWEVREGKEKHSQIGPGF